MSSGKLHRLLPARLPQLLLVEGPSMSPGLPDGAWVVLLPAPGRLPPVGAVVLAEHPHRPAYELVKRVSAVSRRQGLVWLAGDNPEQSTDSQQFGPVPVRLVRGRVILRLRPGRPRWLGVEPSRLWG